MSSWKQAVQAQLLFTQNQLLEAQKLQLEGGSKLQRKQCLNSVILGMRELWQCWLNEWAVLLQPKGKQDRVKSWSEFLRFHVGCPTVEQMVAEVKRADSWAKGFLELESLVAYDWLDKLVELESEGSEELFDARDALSIVQVDIRPCSVLNGPSDIERMLTELKLQIEQVREQHSEW